MVTMRAPAWHANVDADPALRRLRRVLLEPERP
jgi:hypothetical protein